MSSDMPPFAALVPHLPSQALAPLSLALAETGPGRRLLALFRGTAYRVGLVVRRADGADLTPADNDAVSRALAAADEADTLPSAETLSRADLAVASLLKRSSEDPALLAALVAADALRMLCEAEAAFTGESAETILSRRSAPLSEDAATLVS